MLKSRVFRRVLLAALVCVAVSLFSSSVSGPQSLTASAESLVFGGSDCGDFMNGFAIGLGVGALFGCVWCAAGALIAKGVGAFC